MGGVRSALKCWACIRRRVASLAANCVWLVALADEIPIALKCMDFMQKPLIVVGWVEARCGSDHQPKYVAVLRPQGPNPKSNTQGRRHSFGSESNGLAKPKYGRASKFPFRGRLVYIGI